MHEFLLDPQQASIVAAAVWGILATRRFERVGVAALAGSLPALVVISAPSARSGRATRSIGRRRNEASPSKRAVIPRPAHSPIRRRAVVPELRASIIP